MFRIFQPIYFVSLTIAVHLLKIEALNPNLYRTSVLGSLSVGVSSSWANSEPPSNECSSYSQQKASLFMSSSTDTQETKPNRLEALQQAKAKIRQAIAVGAPAYNAGDIDECARVYRDTALEVVGVLADISSLQQSLTQTLSKTEKVDDSNANAWAFRGDFDAILDFQLPFLPQSVSESSKLEPFTEKMVPVDPIVVNDNVMGGVSMGGWNKDTRTFSGSTSLANNGGFSSIRWRMPNIQNWSYAKGIYLKGVQHKDTSQTFQLMVKDALCEQVRLANYKATFANPEQASNDIIYIPFETFSQMEQMGRPVPAPAFNRGAVTELGIMAIKPTVVGEFSIQIDEWGLYL